MKPGQKFVPLGNCHAKGLFSIPLHVTDTFVERMFIDTLGMCHTVAPHSHRYALGLELVTGRMNHSIWQPNDLGAVGMYQFRWHSPVSGSDWGRFERAHDSVFRYNVETDEFQPGATTRMDSIEVHSLVTEPGTSWIITESVDDQQDMDTVTLHWHPEYKPDLTDLYIPLDSTSLRKMR